MLTKTEFLTALREEIRVTVHLGSKLQAEHLGYRFSPAQRSLQELLAYLATQLSSAVGYFVTGSWDLWEVNAAKNANVTPATFAAAMQAQYEAIERLLNPISDQRFVTKTIRHWSGKQMTVSQACTDYVLRFATSYKMQLFLQAKAAGLSTLNSGNLWQGVDPA